MGHAEMDRPFGWLQGYALWGFAVDAEWVTAMVAGWLGGGYGGWVWLHSVPETPSYGTEYACRAKKGSSSNFVLSS